jgi:signal transduction histidine kinase
MGEDNGIRRRRQLRLHTQLLVLLLVFGAIPVAVSVGIGYTVSRAAMIHQAEQALIELTLRQADYLGNEIRRQRLLLRTISGHIAAMGGAVNSERLALAMAGSLPDDGVFDGLRLVGSGGSTIRRMALRKRQPDWPMRPVTTWRDGTARWITIHRRADEVVAYLLTIPVDSALNGVWIEGHVPATEFQRLFDIPQHLMSGAELGIVDSSGAIVLSPHPHSAAAIGQFVRTSPHRAWDLQRAEVGGVRSIVYVAQVPETPWVLAAVLPLRLVLAPLATLRAASIAFGGILVALIVIAANGAASMVTNPVRKLAVAADEFGRTGEYTRLASPGVAEVDALVSSFDYMASALREASGVAHEIRNPLTGILGAVEVAARQLQPGDAALPLLQEAETQLRRIASTTSRLLEFARPPTIQHLVVDAKRVAERASRVVAGTARSAGVVVAVPAGEPLPVHADPELLVQVLVNLLLNGIEAMPQGGALHIDAVEADGDVRIRVRDEGTGIPDAHHMSLFRPFFSTKANGTGLGLAISRQIIERHGGALRLESTSPSGTTFVITVPRAAPGGELA